MDLAKQYLAADDNDIQWRGNQGEQLTEQGSHARFASKIKPRQRSFS